MAERNYKQENKYKAQPEQIAKRVARNQARAILEKKVGKAALAGKEVHHRNGVATDNSVKNLKAVKPVTHNFGRAGAQGGKMKGKC